MTDHLGYEKHDPAGHHRGNTRNGKSQKTLQGDFGELELETRRDRQATFDPKIVAKGQTRWTGFRDKIISMYARGMTTREIQGAPGGDLWNRGFPHADIQKYSRRYRK
jgi:putative transposase